MFRYWCLSVYLEACNFLRFECTLGVDSRVLSTSLFIWFVNVKKRHCYYFECYCPASASVIFLSFTFMGCGRWLLWGTLAKRDLMPTASIYFSVIAVKNWGLAVAQNIYYLYIFNYWLVLSISHRASLYMWGCVQSTAAFVAYSSIYRRQRLFFCQFGVSGPSLQNKSTVNFIQTFSLCGKTKKQRKNRCSLEWEVHYAAA